MILHTLTLHNHSAYGSTENCYSKLNKAPTPTDNVYTLMEYVHQVYESGGGYIKRSKLINIQ